MKKISMFFTLLFVGALSLHAQTIPMPVTPLNNGTGYMAHPGFTWGPVPGAGSYEIKVVADTGFTNILTQRAGLPVTRYVPLDPLPAGKLYWRVRSVDTAGNSSGWSARFSYTVATPANVYTVPDNSNYAQVKAILDTAVKHTPAIVQFAANGHYALDPGTAGSFMFTYTGINDLIIDGNQAAITVMNHPETGFLNFRNSNRITVKGFTVDWDPLPHSLLDVVQVDTSNPNTLNIRARLRSVAGQTSPYYPAITNNPSFTTHWSWAYLLDPAHPGAVKPGIGNAFGLVPGDVTYIAGTNPAEYNIVHPGSTSGKYFAPGDILTILCRTNMGSFISTTNCTDLTFSNITNYASPMGCYYAFDGGDMKVLHCHSALKDNTRFVSANADGVHCRGNTIGPWVENSSFTGNGDDGVALYNKGMVITAKNAANSLTVKSDYMNFKTGDRFDIYIPKTGNIISQNFTVNSVQPNTGQGTFTVLFSPAIADSSYAAITDVNLSDQQQNAQLYNSTRRNEQFYVYNNTFTVRGRGVILRSANGAVDSNRLYNCSSPAVALYNEAAQWLNGLYSSRVSILRNNIRDCAYDNLGIDEGAITVKFRKIVLQGSRYIDAIAPTRPHNGILINNNKVENFAQHGITLFNATGSQVGNNIFTSNVSGYIQPGAHYGIYLNTTDSCTISRNNFTGETRPLTAVIQQTNSTNVVVIP
ncbi:right-handed parallel beta-helix repeat-containing protein [Chitinophaga varians]|uniref:right-handed parallel beta-helix repeat-containing protein n=1 Tax=Chitinophaga varians TaxID=2202339 RepID=UPI00165FD927|nr:right-handed parallel beta-helix repeat-containing protein [Chitinophaga varians]MBC9911765.1 right-handed parallel beta-helix repeat-containing protein [Chitinophaga varians]